MELLGSGSDRSAAFRYSGSGFDEISSNQGITAGEWTHVAVTYDGNELAMYINGQLDGSLNEDGGIGNGGTADIRLGTGSSANSNFYAGQLDEIRVWDSYRSPEQINNSYDNELLGNESGLVGYWRGCNVAGNDQARGSAVRPMTANLTNVECQSSGVPMEDSSAEDSGILDFGIELQSEATVSQGSSVDINTLPNNRANQAVSGTLELRVDQNGDSQFSATETVSSKQVSFDASESRTEVLSYNNVPLGAGDYLYQARMSSNGQTVTSFTSGTLTVTTETSTPTPTPSPSPVPDDNETAQTTTVTVNLDSVPAGLQTFNVSVAGPSGSSITTVSAGVLSGNSFEIVSGGEGDSTVTARGADITGTVEQSSESESEPVRLYEAEFEFADTVERSDLTVTANALTNDNGAAISESRLTVTTAGENPVIIGDNQAPAADLNGDGKLEDVNGDGEANFEDGIALAFNIGTASNNAESFDFDGDGDVDFDDAIALVFQV
jgi:hypothetical protein